MKITFLGQAGLLFETKDKMIVIDPYLSNSVEKINFKNYRSRKINAHGAVILRVFFIIW